MRRVALFLAIIVIGAWPSPSVRGAASALLAPALSACLQPFEFGHGGRAQVRGAPVSELRRAGENVSSDAELVLHIDGYANESISAINLRRDAYLPLLLVTAALITRPRRLLAALPLTFTFSVGSLYVTACWLFAHQVPEIYPLASSELRLLDALVSTLLMPPSVRFVVPLLIALSFDARAARPDRCSPRTAPPATS